jgi:hypothetical protein
MVCFLTKTNHQFGVLPEFPLFSCPTCNLQKEDIVHLGNCHVNHDGRITPTFHSHPSPLLNFTALGHTAFPIISASELQLL